MLQRVLTLVLNEKLYHTITINVSRRILCTYKKHNTFDIPTIIFFRETTKKIEHVFSRKFHGSLKRNRII